MRGNRQTIRTKLLSITIGGVSILILIMMILTKVILDIQIRKDYMMQSKNQMQILADNIKDYYTHVFNDIEMFSKEYVIKNAGNSITTYKNINENVNLTPSKNGEIEEEIYIKFNNYGITHDNIQYVYFATADGGYINWPKTYINQNYDPTERSWYKEAVKAKGNIISTEPYLDKNNSLVVSNVKAIYDDNGDLIGVIGIDIFKEALSDSIESLKVLETGHYAIVSENGLVVADGRNSDNNLRYLDEDKRTKLNEILAEEENIKFSIDGEKFIGNYIDVEDTTWKIFFTISIKELNRATKKINGILAVMSIILLTFMIYLIIKGLRKLTKPIEDVANYLIEIGNGNFEDEIKEDYLIRKDEIGTITNGIYNMRGSLVKLIHEIENELMLFKKIADENEHSYILIYNEERKVVYENNKFSNKANEKSIDFMNETFIEEIGKDKLLEIKDAILQKGFYNGCIKIKDSVEVYEATIQEIFGNRNEKFTVVNVIEITEKIKSQEAILKYEKIKSHEEVKTEFFANMSHELKTPLNIFYSTFQLLELKSREEPEIFLNTYNKHKSHLGINCKRMLRLINNLVDITKIDVGYTKADFKDYDIVMNVEDITSTVANYAKQKKVNLLFDTEVEELVIKCDIYMIERVILNLLSNAIKFTPEGGNILVYIFVDLYGVHIRVKDDGIGVPEELREIIFDRFTQSDRSLTRLNEGSGIGLSIVKSLVELNNGSIILKESEGKGATFEVTLPNERLGEVICESKEVNVNFTNVEMEFSDIYDLY